ncbi:phage tail protein I [Lysinibacillus telephonicus]|uniref:Phage tail protein I n=1 Tax=Lysinibacillus telephonicus TaxID=1714840 RepID=A0A3S0HL42_9BACI|nr:phage tail protein I [Lysinibacillus telephonicus]RTQ95599.1 phage tail protein I [Lysinibacillus telephonicus]
MSKTIYEVQLMDLLPESLKNDPDIIAASKAVDLGFSVVVNAVDKSLILPRIDQLESDVLDHVAYFFHVDFYDRSLDIETKRKLIKESVYIHQIKGTPAAVEILIETLFDEGTVEEWFDYGGNPYRFRVVTSNQSVTQERAEEFLRALNTVKNTRSHLDSVIILQTEQMDFKLAGIVHQGIHEVYGQVN